MLGFMGILVGAALVAAQDTAGRRDSTPVTRLDPLEVRVTRGTETRRKAPVALGVID